MHSDATGSPCAWCGTIFRPRRSWARWCSPKCRNDYHHWAKPQTVRELRELARLAIDGGTDPAWFARARKVLGIKPPALSHPEDADRRDVALEVSRP